MYYSLLNCGILQGFPALRKNRNSTGEKLRWFFTCEIFFKGLPSLEKLPVRRVQVVVFKKFTSSDLSQILRKQIFWWPVYDLQNLFDSLCRAYFVLWLTGSVACPARTSFRLLNIVSRIIKLWHSFSVWYRLMVVTSTQRPSRRDSEQHSKTFLNSVKHVN